MKPITHAQRMRALRSPAPDLRPSASDRGYDRGWRKRRAWYLNRHPMCAHPECDRAATDVDHVVSRARGGDDADANLQALCHSHHSAKTAREDGGFGRKV